MSRPPFKASPGVALRPHPHGHLQYLSGPLHADLGMAISLRAGAEIPPLLFAGLLSQAADPDGHGYEELDVAGYQRQSVDLYPAGLARLAVPRPVTFEALDPLLATHVAIFTAPQGAELLWRRPPWLPLLMSPEFPDLPAGVQADGPQALGSEGRSKLIKGCQAAPQSVDVRPLLPRPHYAQ